MPWPRDQRPAAKPLNTPVDPFVIRGNDEVGKNVDLLSPFIYALDHGLAKNQGQRLSFKPRRGVPARNNTDYFHDATPSRLPALRMAEMMVSRRSLLIFTGIG